VFAASVLERLALIALGRSAGLSLDEMALMFVSNGRLKVDRKLLADKADELDKSIRQMTTMRDGLRHAAACSAPSHMECPKFRRLLGLAAYKTVNDQGKKKSARPQRLKKVKRDGRIKL
jgi:hypothetical protein